MKREIRKGNIPREKHLSCAWQNVTDKCPIRREAELKSTNFKKILAMAIPMTTTNVISHCQLNNVTYMPMSTTLQDKQ